MKRIFIVRHGKTQWNLEHRLQGRYADSDLLTDDLTPYQQAAAYLDQYRYQVVFASPIKRAIHTAQLVTDNFTQPVPTLQTNAGLAELTFGDWEGKSKDELVAEQPALFRKLSQRVNTPELDAIGVENFAAARARFAQAIREIGEQLGPDDTALVFSHGGISQLGIKELTGNEHLLGLKNLSTSIVALRPDGAFLDVYNQTAYLHDVDLNEGNVSIM
ncbi:hypothetical protein AYR62_02830 [Secundilactobacillus paracollinoides]|uniref:Phosphoglycerate mutase n=1 Tax=Secundilactobacillus paracollinoides TaxID=240427 RepID=A0A1B2IUK7_9LACO|nr:histidine phosphatase family protein [Secundilactobacillus paracollinoides]ANZ59908.1 hypothetical protein AYR61_00080 [Secundilactobacillus paracollinoides]ANZ63134.1 hypothetical protein AYR62_02830 [Secundilactobacillus paracollinoides]ANZ65699.1 hypothetical protein AYR63_00085 [Secundilactobacillus paracollinoides]KRL75557.1 phosphoglycerate mutase [Secundilactobacillus paracollinoides DSM 15502 = JCM 11969]